MLFFTMKSNFVRMKMLFHQNEVFIKMKIPFHGYEIVCYKNENYFLKTEAIFVVRTVSKNEIGFRRKEIAFPQE